MAGDRIPGDFLILAFIYRLIAILPGPTILNVGSETASFHFRTATEVESGLHIIETERDIIKEIVTRLDKSDVFFDIGANIGVFSAFAPSEVVAFEPIPANVMALSRIFETESDGDIIATALSDSEEYLWFDNDNIAQGSPTAAPNETGDGTAIATKRLDEMDISTPTVVKIDVEGAELRVLRGAIETLRSNECEAIYIEVHESAGISQKKVMSILDECGFTEFDIIDERGEEKFLRAEKHPSIT